MESNLRLIKLHAVLAGGLVWMPTFVLAARERFGLAGAITLSGLYYLFVVVLEVPSGWASDRFGRVNTLRVAAASWILSHALFLGAGLFASGNDRAGFALFVAGQAALAAGFACLSGTDVSFHYDTLEVLGKAELYRSRQSSLSSLGYLAKTVAALVGGLAGWIDLRLPFAIALMLAVAQLGVSLRFVEPSTEIERRRAGQIWTQVAGCLRLLRSPIVGWLFFYGLTMVILEHVAGELLQPWLTEATGFTADAVGTTPLWSGLLLAVVAFVGAGAARLADPAARRFGVFFVLFGTALVSVVIVSAMAASFHLAVLALIVFRSVQGAAAPVVLSAALAPRIAMSQRATFFSLNSLAGRLSWGLLLLAVAGSVGDDLGAALTMLSLASWVCLAAIVLTAVPYRFGRSASSQ